MKTLITGATHGMGRGVAHALALRDEGQHEVVILGRDRERCAATVRELRSVTGNEKLSFVLCDLASLRSVKSAIEVLRAEHGPIDALFVNAGLGYAARRETTEDGMDPHFQVNYLSQFMLTLHLLDSLASSPSGGRVIFNATRGGALRWDDLQMTKKWGYEAAIQQSMVAKRMFALRLHALARQRGSALSCVAYEIPKTVWSNQINIIPWPMRAAATVMKWLGAFITVERCGELMAPLFTEPHAASLARSGTFVTSDERGFVTKEEEPLALDSAQHIKLWDESVRLIGDEATARIAERWAARA